ncbi:hypothetical protein BO99DRAFT_137843 [Aspergillus violaceofuscus CBS 115571]|uniref:Uncharacterized protein n=1 Tax=Aspergillus violaceofuscus (strain CBS 115571) TaxID=1450538 RepID=A0A2V5H7T7_ASPV1|nr:hypothetical protein BO99DRAFT_137843 [Aspergillus violaceofuscus CBS 115571]
MIVPAVSQLISLMLPTNVSGSRIDLRQIRQVLPVSLDSKLHHLRQTILSNDAGGRNLGRLFSAKDAFTTSTHLPMPPYLSHSLFYLQA